MLTIISLHTHGLQRILPSPMEEEEQKMPPFPEVQHNCKASGVSRGGFGGGLMVSVVGTILQDGSRQREGIAAESAQCEGFRRFEMVTRLMGLTRG